MRYTKEKSLKSRRPNEKASEMKGRIARGLLSVALVGVLTTIMPFNANANSSNVYYLGEVVNAGKDTGFSENNEITKKDPHYNWTLGSFSVNGYTRVITNDGNPIFLKTVGDEVVLDFQLEQDIDALNNDKSLMIANDKKAYDNLLYKDETAFGRGALIIRKTDAYQNKKGTSQLYTDYLSGVKVGANTQVEICEEGDYEVALDYSIRDKKITVPFIDKTIRSTYNDYKIYFTFSVRNGNCMVFPFDVATGEELTNKAITENGFYLDLAKSRYLEINVKKEVLREGATGLTEDVRFNKPASDGEKYTDEGIYTITVSNPYTEEETVKKIYVGTNSVLKAYMTTGYAISDIQSLLKDGATIDDDGNITIPEKVEKPKVVENVSESAIVLNEANDDAEEKESVSAEKDNKDDEAQFATNSMVGGSICIVLALFIVYLFVKKKKKDKKVNMTVPIDPEESVTEKSPEEDEV
ncbi:hypothetical protein [Dorea sp. YH-dor228]|uniref:hypothetical protein n=1 Tax=Dorea sp. YH-dor228 TaxID=3151120 RepID=UPI003241EC9A